MNKFEVVKFTSLYDHPYTKTQHANGLIQMDIDFSPCYNWNNNLIFAWITATYKTGKKDVYLLFNNLVYHICNSMG